MTELDRTLVRRARRAPTGNEVSLADRVAINVLWRDGVRMKVIRQIFNRGKNTIYQTALTGTAPSYKYGKAREVNDFIEEIGIDEARRRYVTEAMLRIVNEANKAIVASYK